MALKIATSTKDTKPIVRLRGELDVSQGGKLQAHVAELLAGDQKNVVLNMVHLDYLDSSGLGSLVAVAKLFRSSGGRVILITNDFVDEILTITRLGDVFESADDEASALRLLDQA